MTIEQAIALLQQRPVNGAGIITLSLEEQRQLLATLQEAAARILKLERASGI